MAFPTQPVVEVQDAGGNVVISYTSAVTVEIAANPSAGTLAGTASVNAVNGVATFSGLSINNAGTGYTLRTGSGALPTARRSVRYHRRPSNKAGIRSLAQQLARRQWHFPTQPVVEAQDAGGNLVVTYNEEITLAIAYQPWRRHAGWHP